MTLREVEKEIVQEGEDLEGVVEAFVEMYQKILEISVMHYLGADPLNVDDLHAKIAKVVVIELIKIIKILFQQISILIRNPNIPWHEKIKKCWWVIGLIVTIKFWAQQMPYNKAKTADS